MASKILQDKRREGTLNVMKITSNGKDPQCEVQNLKVDYSGAELTDLYNRYLSMVYAHTEVDSVQVDKKERALTDEINANNDSTAMIRHAHLTQRLRAVDQTRTLWNLDVNAEINLDLLKHNALISEDPTTTRYENELYRALQSETRD